MTNNRKWATLLIVLCVSSAGWYVWKLGSSHGHGVEIHEHSHVHGTGIDHDHDHEDISGTVTHSHTHQHDRHQHNSDHPFEPPGLIEIGHSHQSGGTAHYWAKLMLKQDKRLVLQFFRSINGELNSVLPKAEIFNAQIVDAGRLEGSVEFENLGDDFISEPQTDFLTTPTQVFKIDGLEFGRLKLDVALPVTQ